MNKERGKRTAAERIHDTTNYDKYYNYISNRTLWYTYLL